MNTKPPFKHCRTSPEYKECQIVALPQKYHFETYAYGFPKNSPYLPLFNHQLQKAIENGVLNQILKSNKVQAEQECQEELGSIDIETIYGPLLIFAGGIGLALIFFLIELISFSSGCYCHILDNISTKYNKNDHDWEVLLNEKNAAIKELNEEISSLKDHFELVINELTDEIEVLKNKFLGNDITIEFSPTNKPKLADP